MQFQIDRVGCREDMRYKRSTAKGATFFFTLVTYNRQALLCHEENIRLLREAFHRVMQKHPFTIDAFVALPDHLHCIWRCPRMIATIHCAGGKSNRISADIAMSHTKANRRRRRETEENSQSGSIVTGSIRYAMNAT